MQLAYTNVAIFLGGGRGAGGLDSGMDSICYCAGHGGHGLLGAARDECAESYSCFRAATHLCMFPRTHASAPSPVQVVAHECGHGAFSDNKLIQARVAGPHIPAPDRQIWLTETLAGRVPGTYLRLRPHRTRWATSCTASCWCRTSPGNGRTRSTTAAPTTSRRARRTYR